jgi:hypothetical protein
MTIEEASKLKVGDVIFNIFQEELVVSSIHLGANDKISNIICVNTGLFLESYSPSVLYNSLDDLTINEYSFLLWVSKNKTEMLDSDNVELVKKAYIEGYSQGFSDKTKCSGNKCKGQKDALD